MINNYRYIIEIFFINILNHILSITSQVNYILHMIYLTSSFITRMIFRQKKNKKCIHYRNSNDNGKQRRIKQYPKFRLKFA